MNIFANLEKIKPNLQNQTIIAATKYVGVKEIKELVSLGITNIGENKVQSFLEKYEVLQEYPITWHFIGHLQTNKVKKVINKIDFLHSLDRQSLAISIQKERITTLNCFLEVNITEESNKTGMNVKEVIEFVNDCQKYDKICIVGLMTMATLTDDESLIEHQFMSLVKLQSEIQALKLENAPTKYLSMGMSNDYLIAIKCHSTHLRLGSILFRNEE
ncbi:MAG: YggS family pyridoxal phosphate-dependent enzyme [Candidatus Izemoplasmatales bacterium]|jgi:hypothetical protein|nr:YggS family pyridoxal phosphate-dependent enzyme [Candidatus Izemoplasmatales bacterium]